MGSLRRAVARAYRDFFHDVKLERSRWRLLSVKEPVVTPLTSQNSLSLSLKKSSRGTGLGWAYTMRVVKNPATTLILSEELQRCLGAFQSIVALEGS